MTGIGPAPIYHEEGRGSGLRLGGSALHASSSESLAYRTCCDALNELVHDAIASGGKEARVPVYLPGRQVRDRYNVSEMTIWRWLQNAELKFPKPTVINRRRYWLLEELEQWERERAVGTSGAAS